MQISQKKPFIANVCYGRVLRIEARKTQPHICDDECKSFQHAYAHDFKPGAMLYRLSNGDLLVSARSGLIDEFVRAIIYGVVLRIEVEERSGVYSYSDFTPNAIMYGLSRGVIVISSRKGLNADSG